MNFVAQFKNTVILPLLLLTASTSFAVSDPSMTMINFSSTNFMRLSYEEALTSESAVWIFKTSPSNIKIDIQSGPPVLRSFFNLNTLTITINGVEALKASSHELDFLEYMKSSIEDQIKKSQENGEVVVDWTSVEQMRVHAPPGYYPDRTLPFMNIDEVFVKPSEYVSRLMRVKNGVDNVLKKLGVTP